MVHGSTAVQKIFVICATPEYWVGRFTRSRRSDLNVSWSGIPTHSYAANALAFRLEPPYLSQLPAGFQITSARDVAQRNHASMAVHLSPFSM